MTYIGVPTIVTLMLMMLLSAIVRSHHRRKLLEAQRRMEEQEQEIEVERNIAVRERGRADGLQSEFEMHKAAEEERVRQEVKRRSIQIVRKSINKAEREKKAGGK